MATSLEALRDKIATELNAAIDVPFLKEDFEEAFFRSLIETCWNHIPANIRNAIAKGADLIPPAMIENLRGDMLTMITKELRQWLPFIGPDHQEQLAQKFVSHLCSVATAK